MSKECGVLHGPKCGMQHCLSDSHSGVVHPVTVSLSRGNAEASLLQRSVLQSGYLYLDGWQLVCLSLESSSRLER